MGEIKILGKVSKELEETIRPIHSSVDTQYYFVDFSIQDIDVGFVFTKAEYSGGEEEEVRVVLNFVTQQYFKPMPLISKGYKCIIGLKILKGISCFEELSIINSWYDSTSSLKLFGMEEHSDAFYQMQIYLRDSEYKPEDLIYLLELTDKVEFVRYRISNEARELSKGSSPNKELIKNKALAFLDLVDPT